MGENSYSRKEFDLPIEIIQHIQSFIENSREEAQTCILNKSWFAAWSTRPILAFNQNRFPIKFSNEYFSNFCKTTIRRYKQSNLKVDSLIFSVINSDSITDPLAHELIIDVLKLGVNKIILRMTGSFHVPAQVFSHKRLTSLSLNDCIVDTDRLVVGGSWLTTLKLHYCNIVNTNKEFHDTLLACPLMENLEMMCCWGLTNVDLSKMRKLVKVHVSGTSSKYLDFKVHNIGLASNHGFNYLRSLQLYHVNLNYNEFFSKFSSTFPCIEELGLVCDRGIEDVQISSNSLRDLTLATLHVVKKVRLNVPKLSKFVFEAVNKPIHFRSFGITASRNCECDIHFSAGHEINEDSNWFVDFKKFLAEFRQYRISLRISISEKCTASTERILCFPIPVVEDLQVYGPPSAMSPNLVCGLFWSCQPGFISYPIRSEYESAFVEFLYKHLIQSDNKELLCMYNLKEFSLEEKKYPTPWQSIPLTDDLLHLDKIRIRLKWGEV